VIFVLENSHFGHLKTCFSAPLACGALLASSIRVRHIAQRGGLIVSRDSGAGLSDDGMVYPGEERCLLEPIGGLSDRQTPGVESAAATVAAASSNPGHISDDHEYADGGHGRQGKGHA
jgi:hypothetical protein